VALTVTENSVGIRRVQVLSPSSSFVLTNQSTPRVYRC
jgi:hypothetical protein